MFFWFPAYWLKSWDTDLDFLHAFDQWSALNCTFLSIKMVIPTFLKCFSQHRDLSFRGSKIIFCKHMIVWGGNGVFQITEYPTSEKISNRKDPVCVCVWVWACIVTYTNFIGVQRMYKYSLRWTLSLSLFLSCSPYLLCMEEPIKKIVQRIWEHILLCLA